MGPAWAGRKQRGVGRGVVQAGEDDGGQDGVGRAEAGQGGSEQSARETTTRGACDKQDGQKDRWPNGQKTAKQTNKPRNGGVHQ